MADSKEVFKPGWRALDANGNVLPGAYIECYEAGTDTARDLYYDVTDADEADWLSIGSTVECDSGGYPTSDGNAKCVVYTGVNAYKLKLYTTTDVLVWEHDFIPGAVDTSSFGGDSTVLSPVSTVSTDQTLANSDNGKLYNVNCSGGDIVFTLPPAVGLDNGWRVGVRHNGSANQVRFISSGGDLIGIPNAASLTAFAITSRGQEIWIRSDQGGFIVGEVAPPLLNTTGVIVIADRLSTPPGSPEAGARYIVTAAPTGDWSSFTLHDIAEATGNGTWFRYTPAADCGWIAYVQDEDITYRLLASAWVPDDIVAVQSVMETGTDLTKKVTPGVQKHHPAHPKAWGIANAGGTLTAGHGISSVVDVGTGSITFNFSTSFSSTSYGVVPGLELSGNNGSIRITGKTVSSVSLSAYTLAGTDTDPNFWHIAAFGDHA